MRAAAIVLSLVACASCASEANTRGPDAPAAPAACSALVGRWREVEPTDGTNIDEPEDGKVRAIDPGSRLYIEPTRVTVLTPSERAESHSSVEPAEAGTCVLHARDSKGRPMDVQARLVTDRLLRTHNIAEPKSPATLYERE